MSLIVRIDAELKAAMIARDAEKTSVLRMLKSAVKYAAIEKSGADAVPSDEEVIVVARKEIKKRQDSIESYNGAGRPELAEKENKEMVILQAFLPAAMSEAEVVALVEKAIADTGATSKAQMGIVMKSAQALAQGRVDGKTLSHIVQKRLGA